MKPPAAPLPQQPALSATGGEAAAARRAREAALLRENLRRRKRQARARDDYGTAPGTPLPPTDEGVDPT